MKRTATEVRLSELTDLQKSHMMWRLDSRTWAGIGAIGALFKYQWGDVTLVEAFEMFDKSTHSAKIHARKVLNFTLDKSMV